MIEADSFYEMLGRSIRSRRDALGLTQQDLAQRLNLSRTSVTNIERGRQRLLIDQFCMVAQILKCDYEELLAGALGKPKARPRSNANLEELPTVAKFVHRTLTASKAGRS